MFCDFFPYKSQNRQRLKATCRSLNLSNSVAVGVYEVLRQWDFPELLDHGHLRDYEWK